jgi:hypothetical protein
MRFLYIAIQKPGSWFYANLNFHEALWVGQSNVAKEEIRDTREAREARKKDLAPSIGFNGGERAAAQKVGGLVRRRRYTRFRR